MRAASLLMALPEIVPLRERQSAGSRLRRCRELLSRFRSRCMCFPDPVERAALSPALFTPLPPICLLFRGGFLPTAGGPVGLPLWLGPAAWGVTPERAKAAGVDDLPMVLGAGAAERFLIRARSARIPPP